MKKIQEAQATQETREGNLLIQQNGELKNQEESTIKNQETTVKKQETTVKKQEETVKKQENSIKESSVEESKEAGQKPKVP